MLYMVHVYEISLENGIKRSCGVFFSHFPFDIVIKDQKHVLITKVTYNVGKRFPFVVGGFLFKRVDSYLTNKSVIASTTWVPI